MTIEIWANACDLGQRNGGYATFRGDPDDLPDCYVKTLLDSLPPHCDVAMRHSANGWKEASIPCCDRPGSCVHTTLFFPSESAKETHIKAYLEKRKAIPA